MKRTILFSIVVVLIFLLWELAANTNSTVRLLISSPRFIGEYFHQNFGDLLKATGITLAEAFIGLAIAAVFSFIMMIICFYYPRFMRLVLPVMVVSQVIPLIVLAPFFIILFGTGIFSKIAMAALLSFFPIFINFSQGYRAISKNIHELMFIYQAPIRFRIRHIYFPLCMPNILAGFKVSCTLSVIGAIVAEFSGTEFGLGKNLYVSALRLEPELMLSSLALSTCIGLFFFGIIRYLEGKLTSWV